MYKQRECQSDVILCGTPQVESIGGSSFNPGKPYPPNYSRVPNKEGVLKNRGSEKVPKFNRRVSQILTPPQGESEVEKWLFLDIHSKEHCSRRQWKNLYIKSISRGNQTETK